MDGSADSTVWDGDGDPATPLRLAPGSRFGAYRIEARVGEGAMGRVYRATDVALDRAVALKLLKPGLARTPGFAERFLREARAAARVHHPRVVAIHACGENAGLLYMALEYVAGGDLHERIRRQGRLPLAEALRILADCAEGLDAIHAQGLVHRDIKPRNIFLGADGRAKLGDFGLARGSDDDHALGEPITTGVGTPLGTPGYMAPEQVRGVHDADIRADIHALGATFYAMLTGGPPYRGETAQAAMISTIEQPVPDPGESVAGLPDAVRAFARRILAKDRAQRHATPAALLAELRGLRADPAAIRVRRAPPRSPPRPAAAAASQRRHAGILVGAGLVALSAVALLAWAWLPRAAPPPSTGTEAATLALIAGVADQAGDAELERAGRSVDAWLAAAPATGRAAVESAWAARQAAVQRHRQGERAGAAAAALLSRIAACPDRVDDAAIAALGAEIDRHLAADPPLPEHRRDEVTAAWNARRAAIAAWRAQQDAGMPPWAGARGADAHGAWIDLVIAGVAQRLRWCPPGIVTLGSPPGEPGRRGDEHRHQARVPTGFWMADSECTQRLWHAVLGERPARWKDDDRPVEQVSWDDCQRFLAKAAALVPGAILRLPSEVEWEHACRAGAATAYAFGDDPSGLDAVANCADRALAETLSPGSRVTPDRARFDGHANTAPVRSFRPNRWGFHDLHGNVWEWCAGVYAAYPGGSAPGAGDPRRRVCRGGGWGDPPDRLRAAYRNWSFVADERNAFVGFRFIVESAAGPAR